MESQVLRRGWPFAIGLVVVGSACAFESSGLRSQDRSAAGTRPAPAAPEVDPNSPLGRALTARATYHKDKKRDLAVLRLARKRIGVTEDSQTPNSGREIDRYLSFCGIRQPGPWCAAFVAQTIHTAYPHSLWLKSACCQHVYLWAAHNKLIVDEPVASTVVLIPGPDNTFHHTGFVIGYDKETGVITTIEGNSNTEGSFDGGSVLKRQRVVEPGFVFVRIV